MFAQSLSIQFSLFDIFSQVGKWNKILTRLNIMILDQLKFYDTETLNPFPYSSLWASHKWKTPREWTKYMKYTARINRNTPRKIWKGTVLVFAEKLTSLSLFYFMISKCNLIREKLALQKVKFSPSFWWGKILYFRYLSALKILLYVFLSLVGKFYYSDICPLKAR